MVPEDSPQVWADRKDLKETLDISFRTAAQRQRSVLIGMWGYLGAGKSHSLLYFKHLIDSQKLGFTIYSPIPKALNNFGDIYRQAFYRSLNFVQLATIMGNFYLAHSSMPDNDIIEIISTRITGNWLDMASALLGLGKATSGGGIASPFIQTLNSWFGGARLAKQELRTIRVSSNLVYDADFVKAAASLIRAITFKDGLSAGFPLVFWIVDDCHYLAEIKKSKRIYSNIQQGLRDVFDACPTNLCAVIAFAARQPSALADIVVEDLYSRITERIEVPPLSRTDCILFVKDLLNNIEFRSKQARGDFYPFTKESTEAVMDLLSSRAVDLTPRNLMKVLDLFAGKAEREIYPKTIDKDFIEDHADEAMETLGSMLAEG